MKFLLELAPLGSTSKHYLVANLQTQWCAIPACLPVTAQLQELWLRMCLTLGVREVVFFFFGTWVKTGDPPDMQIDYSYLCFCLIETIQLLRQKKLNTFERTP